MKFSLIIAIVIFSLGVFAKARAESTESQTRCHKIVRKFVAQRARAQMVLMEKLETEQRIHGNDLVEYDRISAPSAAIVNAMFLQCQGAIDSEQVDLLEKTLL